MIKRRLPPMAATCLPALLLGCAITPYPDFNRKLDSAIGKGNAQLNLPLDIRVGQYTAGELTVIEYAYLRPQYCRWRFSYDAAGRIIKWDYPDDSARRECAALAFHIR